MRKITAKNCRFTTYFLLLTFFCSSFVRSQFIQMEVFMDPNPTPFIYNWDQQPELIQVNVFNFAEEPVDVKFIAEIINGFQDVVASTDPAIAPTFTLLPSASEYSGAEVIPVSDMIFSEEYQRILNRMHILPEDNYRLCITVVDATEGIPLTEMPSCSDFLLTGFGSTYLIYPPDGSVYDQYEVTDLVFQWTPAFFDPRTGYFDYQFRLVEVLENQIPEQAIIVNDPLLEECLPGNENQFLWPEDMISLMPGTYAWAVRIVELCGEFILTEYEEVFKFTVGRTITREQDSTITRPGDTVPDDDPRDTPPPEYWGEEIEKDKCSHVTYKMLEGTPISLGMVLEKEEKFKYPRAVPLRGEGIDWDLVKFYCTGCNSEDTSVSNFVVRDEVYKFEWRILEGPGTLNTPPEVEKIDSLQKKIDELKDKISKIADSLKQIHEDTTKNIPEKIQELKNKISEAERILGDKDSLLTVKNTKKDSLDQALDKANNKILKFEFKIDSVKAVIEENLQKIDSIENVLKGTPTEEETAQQGVVAEVVKEKEEKMQELEEKEEEILERSAELAEAIADAEAAILDYLDSYNQLNAEIEDLAAYIVSLETAMMQDEQTREFMQRQRDWKFKALRFILQYAGSANKQKLYDDQYQVESEARKALSVNNPDNRLSHYYNYLAKLNSFNNILSGSCSTNDPDFNEVCNNALSTTLTSSVQFRSVVGSLVETNFMFDIETQILIDSLRKHLDVLEAHITPLKKQIAGAQQVYEEALAAYTSEMEALESEKLTILEELGEVNDKLLQEEGKLNDLIQKRLNDLERNRESYLERLHKLRSDNTDGSYKIESYIDSLARYQNDTLNFRAQLVLVKDEIKQLEQQIQGLNNAIEKLKALLEKTEKKTEELEAKAEDLEKKKKELEEELEKLKEAINKLKNPPDGKSADGLLVYYIPPPLEEILQEPDTFKDRVDSVEAAESQLDAAYMKKEALQGELVKLMDRVSKDLVKYKKVSDRIPELESEVNKLQDEITMEKTRKAQDYLEEQQKTQDEIEDITKNLDSLNKVIEEYVEDSAKIADEIKELKDQIENEDSLLTAKRNALMEKMNQLDYENKQLRNAQNTLAKHQNGLTGEKAKLKGLEEDLAKAQNDLTRASAMQDNDAIAQAKQKIDQLNTDIKLSRDTKIPGIEQSIASTTQSLKSAQLRVKNALEQKDEAWKAWNDVAQNLNGALRDSLNSKNEQLEEVLSGLERLRKLEKNEELDLDETNSKREDKQGDINEKINNEKDIKSKEQSLNQLKKELEDAKADKKKTAGEIDDALKKKDKLIEDANEGLKKAKEKLEQKQKELKDYLKEDEFNVVDFEVKLQLIASDKVVDQWRFGDKPPEKLIKILEYPKDRKPRFKEGNTYASDERPDDQDMPAKCIPAYGTTKGGKPEKELTKLIDKKEPRTIALMYKDGKPLWKEWPVIPDKAPLLAKDVVRVTTSFTPDHDNLQYSCITEEDCEVFPPQGPEVIRDLGNYQWAANTVISHHTYFTDMFWETPYIPKPDEKREQELKPTFFPNQIAGDEKVEDLLKPIVYAGYMIETTKEITGTPDTSIEVRARVVTGDHIGLDNENIEFSVKLKKGKSGNFGFEETNEKISKKTKDGGYAKTEFSFGDGFAEFEILIKWKRGGKTIQTEKCIAVSPISIKILKFVGSVPDFAWEATKKLFKDGGTADDAVSEFPSSLGEEGANAYPSPIHGIAGLMDAEEDFVNEKNVNFSVSLSNITVDPEQDETELYGIGRTTIESLPEDTSITLTAKVDKEYEDVGDPPEDDKEYSTAKATKFKIGSKDQPFVMIMDEPFNPNETVSGNGHLGVDIEGVNIDILGAIKEISLTATDIELEGSDDDYTAIAGTVSWSAGGDPIKRNILGFDFTIDSLVITASMGAGMGGSFKKDSLIPNPVKYYVELEPDGSFMGKLSDIPSFEVKGFKLKEGTAFSLDWHSSKSFGSFAGSFKGVIIHAATLELPSQFAKGEEKSSLSVSEFYIGMDMQSGSNGGMGFGGEISYEGTFMNIGYAGYDFTANKILIGFDHSKLVKGEFSGELALPMPMEGKISTTIGWAENKFTADISTENPIAIPRLGVTMSLKTGSGVTYDIPSKVGSLRINAFMVSQKFGEVDINGFEISSAGMIKADEISINKAIKFGSGFDLYVDKLGFKLASNEYSFMFQGGFSFPRIGIDQMKGSVTIAPGPEIDIRFDNAKIKFEKGPIDFDGEFAYTSSEFKGEFKIGIKKILPQGIEGMLIVGNTKDPSEIDFSYWYTQLTIGTKIPIGQTGLSVLQLGGGVGYNYNPPIGEQEGTPSHNDSFSFKAIIGMGNTPGGELFAGRMEMVLVPGKFSLYGKAWLLSQEDAIYGDGQLNMMWDPKSQLDGYIRMFVGIPDAEGKIFYFNGKINFLYAENDFYIRSETLEGSVLQVIKAEGLVDITKEHLKLKGKLGYALNKEIELAVVTAIVDVSVGASMEVQYIIASKSLDATADFSGHWDVDLDTPLGTADIVSGHILLAIALKANPSYLEVKGEASFSYDVWVYDGDVDVDVTYRKNL